MIRGSQAVGRSNPKDWPAIGSGTEIEPGIVLHQVVLPKGRSGSKVWIYLPKNRGGAKLPCILIGPAGSRLFHGMDLVDGDNPEHLPYVRAGFAVVAYAVDGPLGSNPTHEQVVVAAREFKNAEAGVLNAKDALDYALAKVPAIDPNRIYAAGHSSAGTLALLVAENEPRIRACIAYAPACDVSARLGDRIISSLGASLPGYRRFITASSPNSNPDRLKCPLFLFHADDDSNVPTDQVAAFAALVRETNNNVTFFTVPSGDHYDSMIQQGIPEGIKWLRSLESPAK
ncbi:MAG TPA: prolyl oligopeptidase family serine peptidase [Blastocatellia bacterium]|nr:prolyl oligopeptidase family serine peptidase [Blastocatellia bacterium]